MRCLPMRIPEPSTPWLNHSCTWKRSGDTLLARVNSATRCLTPREATHSNGDNRVRRLVLSLDPPTHPWNRGSTNKESAL